MHALTEDEISVVSGGKQANSISDFIGTAASITAKKLSMVFCVGKEAKQGIHNYNHVALAKVGACVFITALTREGVSHIFSGATEGKKNDL